MIFKDFLGNEFPVWLKMTLNWNFYKKKVKHTMKYIGIINCALVCVEIVFP